MEIVNEYNRVYEQSLFTKNQTYTHIYYYHLHIYLKTNYKKQNDMIRLFSVGFIYATVITGILYYLIKYIAS